MTAAAVDDALDGVTSGDLLSAASDRLRRAGIEAPRRDARLLLAAAAGTSVEQVLGYPERHVDPDVRAALNVLITRRVGREPLSRILGRREFWGLGFAVTPETLDPRPDSECLVETVLREIPGPAAPLRLLDLGTGTGCLLLALLSELPGATGVGVDLSPAAAAVARQNAAELGFAGRAAFVCGDWCAALAVGWDVIVSNPPYIGTRERPALAPEVAGFDPSVALFAGRDGLDAYRRLVPSLARQLVPDGVCVLEIGAGQAEAVEHLLQMGGLLPSGRGRDLAGRERCIVARQDRRCAGNQAKKRVGMGRDPD